MREGVMDFGRTTHPFLSKRPKKQTRILVRARILSKNGVSKGRTQPSQQHISGLNGVLGCDFYRDLVVEEWTSNRSEGRVSLWDDSLGFEVLYELMVGIIQVKLELKANENGWAH